MSGPIKKIQTQMAKRNQIYIIPTWGGIKYLMINFLLFLISLSFANNMALIVTFIMISYFIIQMLETHRIIQDLKFSHLEVSDFYADQALKFKAHFKNSIEEYQNINIQLLNEDKKIKGDPSAAFEKSISYDFKQMPRGKYQYNKIKIFTYGTTKLFYVWRFLPIKEEFFIYPTKKAFQENKLTLKNNISTSGEIDFKEHKKYSHGQSSHRIDWKIFSKIGELYLKDFQFHENQTFNLDFQNFPGEKEERLEFLSYMILNCFQKNIKWSLNLPNQMIKQGHSKKHFKKCMEALSVA